MSDLIEELIPEEWVWRPTSDDTLPDDLTHACLVPFDASVESTKAPAGRFLLSTDVPIPK